MLSMLSALPLLAAASTNVPKIDPCLSQTSGVNTYFREGGYVVPPEATKLVLDVIDDRVDLIDSDAQQIKRFSKSDESERWLDLALYVAVIADHSDVAEQLIKQGADVNARPSFPPFSEIGVAMFKRDWGMELRKERMDANAADSLDIKNFEPFPWTLPLLEQAASCGNVAILKVLLSHHADMYPIIQMNQNGSKMGILPSLMIDRQETSIEVLLDHGYDPCRDFRNEPNPKHLTDTKLAAKSSLSPALVQRIVALSSRCSAPAQSVTH